MLKLKLAKRTFGLKLSLIGLLCASLIVGLVTPPAQAVSLQLDKKVTKKQLSPRANLTAPAFSTTTSNQLLLAFVAADGPGGSGIQTISSVSGGSLNWTLRKRANAPGTGTAEIWQAVAPTAKSNITVKATLSKGSYVGQITVASFTGADTTQNGAVVSASAAGGASSVKLSTTKANSWVWGVGNDWDRAIARTLGTNQVKVDETVNTNVGDTQWVQRQSDITPAAGTIVTTNTISPTNDHWNLVAIEIPSANAGTPLPVAPSVSVNQKAGQSDPTSIDSAAFTIVFSEPIDTATFDASDITLSGTSGTVTNLSQTSPTTWEATITGMASGDTAIVSMAADQVMDAEGKSNTASTSTDNSVTYRVSSTPIALAGWQLTATNTGLAPHSLSCDSLPEYTGPAKVPAGTIISMQRITKSLVLAQGGVTIERSCFKPASSEHTLVQTFDNDLCDNETGCLPPAGLSVIRDSEFDGSLLDKDPLETRNRSAVTAFKGVATLQRNYIHDLGSGIGIIAAGTKLDALVEQNYVTNLKSWGDGVEQGSNHSESFTIRDFDSRQNPERKAVVKNNRFNTDGGNESGSILLQSWGHISNVFIEGNLLEGNNWLLGLQLYRNDGATYSNVHAINNRFYSTGYGDSSVQGGPGWTTWQNNYKNDWNAADNKGALIATP